MPFYFITAWKKQSLNLKECKLIYLKRTLFLVVHEQRSTQHTETKNGGKKMIILFHTEALYIIIIIFKHNWIKALISPLDIELHISQLIFLHQTCKHLLIH